MWRSIFKMELDSTEGFSNESFAQNRGFFCDVIASNEFFKPLNVHRPAN